MLIFLCRRLRYCRRFLGTVVNPLPPLSLSSIPQTCCLFLIIFRHLHHRRWVLWPVFLHQRQSFCRQFPGLVNTQPPSPLETFTQTRRFFCFLFWRLHCCSQFIRIIFLCRRLCICCQLLMPVIAMLQLPSFSPNPRRLRCCLWSLINIVYSFSSANASVFVVNSAVQSVWHRQLSPSCRSLMRIVSNSFLPMPPFLLPIPQAFLPLPTPTLWRYPLSERLLTFELLTSYFFWWRFALVTVGLASLPYHVWYIHCWKYLNCKLNT